MLPRSMRHRRLKLDAATTRNPEEGEGEYATHPWTGQSKTEAGGMWVRVGLGFWEADGLLDEPMSRPLRNGAVIAS
jgi:hypothetical protein